jgi:hypothetical protein
MDIMVSQNNSKLYGIYNVYIVYTIFYILIIESNFKWLQFEMVVNHITSRPFVYILTIGLGWNNLKILHKILCHK